MNTDHHRQEFEPGLEQPDEGYWAALLNEDESPVDIPHDGNQRRETNVLIGADRHPQPGKYVALPEDLKTIRQCYAEDCLIEWQCIGYNRGGLMAEWRSLRGFIPASQLVDFPAAQNPHVRRKALLDRIGQRLNLRIIEFDEEKNRLILSERAAQAGPSARATILQRIKPGDIVKGQVTNLCNFGAFLDLGGIEGLIHISELSWSRVNHPSSILHQGQNIKAFVIGVDIETRRIALSIKRLRPDPWSTVEDRYEPGQIVRGVVSNVVGFGAFVNIEEGLEGLIHVSELAEGQFLHPRNVVVEGETIQVRILNISGKARRMGLSLRLNDLTALR